jgi:uncharacterized protein
MHAICRGLALAAEDYAPEIIVPVGRGGYYPGTLIAHLLRAEVFPVHLSRREDDRVVHRTPRWLAAPSDAVSGKRVLIVDEIASSGETLRMVAERCAEQGAVASRTAVLYAHTWGTDHADYIGLISDELILNPWDREYVHNGQLRRHPEYVDALSLQGFSAADLPLVTEETIQPAMRPS